MYTRCPSCRAEICFQPPANAANLPDGYKHRIKCPSCGVTIGVKLPNRDAIVQVQPTFTPANPNAYASEPIYNAGTAAAVPADDKQAKREARTLAKTQKKSGRSRNAMIFIFAALLVVCSVLGYFFVQGDLDVAQMLGLARFDGISQLETMAQDTAPFAAIFELSVADGMITVLPTIFFLGALLTAALALIGFVCKKYSRLLNLILALGMLAVSACILFSPFLSPSVTEVGSEALADYFVGIIENQSYLVFVPVAIGVLHTLFALIFLKSMKKKQA